LKEGEGEREGEGEGEREREGGGGEEEKEILVKQRGGQKVFGNFNSNRCKQIHVLRLH